MVPYWKLSQARREPVICSRITVLSATAGSSSTRKSSAARQSLLEHEFPCARFAGGSREVIRWEIW